MSKYFVVNTRDCAERISQITGKKFLVWDNGTKFTFVRCEEVKRAYDYIVNNK